MKPSIRDLTGLLHTRGSLIALAVIGTACSHRCSESRKDPAPPAMPSTAATVRTLSLDDYEATVYGAGPGATFAETTAIEHETIAALVPKLLGGAQASPPPDPQIWQTDADAAGFRIETWTVAGGTYWALLERRDRARGAGAYVFRVAPREPGVPILLEAPHNFYDLGTGRLAAELFFAPPPGARPRALFTNTIHRYQLAPGNKKKRRHNPADVAHNSQHAFTIATEAFTIAAGGARVIQVHGFDARSDDDDDSNEPGAVAMVVSAGTESGSSALTQALAAELGRELRVEVKRFPEDVRFLGATTNAQGRMVRRIEHGDFVHIEMAAALRDRLASEPALRAKLGAILFNTKPAT
jgi:hypothetical protein